MRARFIKWKNVVDHCHSNKKMWKAFEKFHYRMMHGDYVTPLDLISSFGNADLVTCKRTNQTRVVFNVGTNKYRLICGYLFTKTKVILYIKFVGTHVEYDRIDACKIDMFKTS